jgi:TonB-linked SusC/RagA family outer membrane protein
MLKIKSNAIFILLMALSFTVFGQDYITGKVADAKSNGTLPGVTVLVKGSTIGTVTDIDGNFKIKATGNDQLVFSFIGFISQTISISGRNHIEVLMAEDVKGLEEVVVIGYGTQKKSDLTGAVASIDAGDFKNVTVRGVDQALQGRVAGVQVTQNSGSPGSPISVRIRGIGTTDNSDPLYVVDGIAVGGIGFLNPNDIEKIDILKDASAAAIYGAAAANGVVLITTKQGKAGKTVVELNMSYGIQRMYRQYDVTNAEENQMLSIEAAMNSRGKPDGSIYWDKKTKAPKEIVYNTNWQDEISQVAAVQNYHLSISGGTENSQYNFSLGYFGQDGIIMNSGYDRITARMNTRSKITDKLTFGTNTTFSNTKKDVSREADEYGPISQAIMMDPGTPVYDQENPQFIWASGPTNIVNPVSTLELTIDRIDGNQMVSNVFLEWDIVSGLKFKSILGANVGYNDRIIFNPTYSSSRADQQLTTSSLEHQFNKNMSLSSENTLQYNKEFGKHNLTALLGYTVFDANGSGNSFIGQGAPNEVNMREFNAISDKSLTSARWGSSWQAKGISYLSRIIYAYNDKYLVTASIRRDGSSKFGKANRFGTFPSASFGWKISNEEFMKNLYYISSLKLRAGWGSIGNNQIPDYAYTTLMSTSGNLAYSFGGVGTDGKRYIGSLPAGIANPEVHWEESVQKNIGIDASFFENRLSFTADFFIKNTMGMLLPVQVPTIVGILSNPISNAGNIENKGLEFEVTHRKVEGDFTYSVSANLTAIKNMVLELGTEGAYITDGSMKGVGSVSRTEPGHPIASFYGFKTEGIFQSQDEINSSATQNAKTAPGDVRFEDLNGDMKITDADQTYIGSPLPKFTYGGNLNCAYKGIDLAIFIQGSYGNQVYNGMAVMTSNNFNNYNKTMLGRWTLESPSTTVPRVVLSDANNNARNSDRWVEDASYVRIKNIQLGYSIPTLVLKSINLKAVRIYIAADNLLTLTKYTGLDPEVGLSNREYGHGPLEIGLDRGNYPQARTLSAGLNITF